MSCKENSLGWVLAAIAAGSLVLMYAIVQLLMNGGVNEKADKACVLTVVLTASAMLMGGLLASWWFGV